MALDGLYRAIMEAGFRMTDPSRQAAQVLTAATGRPVTVRTPAPSTPDSRRRYVHSIAASPRRRRR